jgi:Family of unknown function (DUF5372)
VGRDFVFVAVRRTWGEDRVFFPDEDGMQRSLPRGWRTPATRMRSLGSGVRLLAPVVL